MKIAIVVGHQPSSPGAINKNLSVSEFDFNEMLAKDIKLNFEDYSLTDEIVVVYRETNYQELPSQVNAVNPDLIVSLHANAFNTQTQGCEMLYYHTSKKSKHIADIFQRNINSVLKNKNRGIKPKTTEDKGGYLLRYTKAPAIICEPFFLDNDEELSLAKYSFTNGELTEAYCISISEAVQYLRGA